MAIKSIQVGPASGGPPQNFQNRPNARDVYVDGSTGELVFGSAASGTTRKTAADLSTTQTFTKALTSSAAIASTSPTAGVGYATGAGGAVTQITSSATGVTLNKVTGQITTVALTTAAAAEERFTVTNSAVAATDVIALSTTYNGAGTPALAVANVVAGAFDIIITNLHAANAFNAVMVINFAVIKGVAA